MLRNIPEQCKGNSQKKKNQKKEAMFLDGKLNTIKMSALHGINVTIIKFPTGIFVRLDS